MHLSYSIASYFSIGLPCPNNFVDVLCNVRTLSDIIYYNAG